ncbi:MAG: hypothetical protein F6J89_17670, partial [Symploca sp. SIO1C4]|nr:hypothetical protein [Symploca sp. SIO1C4]
MIKQLQIKNKNINTNEIIDNRSQSNLADNQLLFWFAQKIQPEVQLGLSGFTTTFTINGALSIIHFQRAFQKLINNSDALQTVIDEVDGIPQRRAREHLKFIVNYIDISEQASPSIAYQNCLQELSKAQIDQKERLFDCSLLKIAPEQYVWYLTVDHLISDAWSTAIILQKMSEYYRFSLEGKLEYTQPLPA